MIFLKVFMSFGYVIFVIMVFLVGILFGGWFFFRFDFGEIGISGFVLVSFFLDC